MRREVPDPSHSDTLVRNAARAFFRVVLFALLTGFVAAALVVIAPGYGIDQEHFGSQYERAGISTRPRPSALALYGAYLTGVLRGDLGKSTSFDRAVTELIRERAPVTARNVAAGMAAAWLTAALFALGGLTRSCAAVRSIADAITAVLLCLPAALVAFATVAADAPPALGIAVVVFPRVHRYADELLTSAATSAHVIAARARGLREYRVIFHHIARTAAPALVTLAGVSVNIALTASIPLEVLCDVAGLGQLAWRGALSRDVPLVVAETVILAIVTLTANQACTVVSQRLSPCRA